MRFTSKQLAEHPKREALLGQVNTKIQVPSSDNRIQPTVPSSPLPPVTDRDRFYQFTVPGAPMGKPRMTQRDKWQKRPCVLRYRDYCDQIRAAAKLDPTWGCYAIEISAYVPMPDSWNKNTKAAMRGQMMRSKPDWDNIGKAVCDALFEEDSVLAGGTVWKFWSTPEDARTEITVLYFVDGQLTKLKKSKTHEKSHQV